MYSLDFVKHTLNIYKNREKLCLLIEDILNLLNICRRTLYNWINNDIKVIKNKRLNWRSSPNNYISTDIVDYIKTAVKNNPCFTINELLQNIRKIFSKRIARQTVYNILHRNKITFKRIQIDKYPHTQEKYDNDLDNLRKKISPIKKRIISIDETSIQTGMNKNYGWSEKGERCIIKNPNKNVKRFSLLFGISETRVVGYRIVEGAINGVIFKEFMEEINNPNGRYKYLLDNASIHYTKIVPENIRRKFIYNMPYCPKFNPIEYCNNDLKRELRERRICNGMK